MTIDDFLQSRNMKAFEFAKKINRHPSYISKLKKNKLVPSLIEALVIFQISDEQINIQDMVPKDILKDHGLLKRGSSTIRLIQN